MYTLQIWHGHLSMVQVVNLFVNLSSEFSFLKLSGTKSHIFGGSKKRLSLPKYTEFLFVSVSIGF